MKSIFLILTGLMVSLHVFAGANGSGGGMGVVCKNADGSIKSVELLDLWEARVIYSRIPVSSSESVADQVEQHLQNLKYSIYAADMCVGQSGGGSPGHCDGVRGPEALYKMLEWNSGKFLAFSLPQVHRLRGVTIKKTDDAFEVVTPSDCEIAQLIRFKDTTYGGDILINQDLVDHMDKTNEAALYIHEAYYALLRQTGDENSSLRVRRMVGLSFSGHKFRTLESFLPKQYYECRTRGNQPVSRIFVYTPESGLLCPGTGVVFQVVDLMGMKALDFEEPDSCQLGTEDHLFNSDMPMESWLPFGFRVGFDYSVFVSVGGMNGSKQATIQLLEAPDQQASTKATLNCVLKTTP